jgi:hypothetical protein
LTPRARTERSRPSSRRFDVSLAEEVDRLAARFGGRKALIAHLIGSGQMMEQDRALSEADAAPRESGWGRCTVEIELTRKDLARLDEEARAFGAPRHRWIVALILKKLHGGHQFSRSERINLTTIARQLRKIEAHLFKIVRTLPSRQAAPQDLISRLDEVSDLRSQVTRISAALGEAFRGDDEYWRQAASASTDAASEHGADRRS